MFCMIQKHNTSWTNAKTSIFYKNTEQIITVQSDDPGQSLRVNGSTSGFYPIFRDICMNSNRNAIKTV